VAFGAAMGTDGVVLIDQAWALAGGVTPGDTAGFSVTISVSGSYRLSGNLTVPDENTNAIVVATANISIDLNGFSILGPTTCGGSPFARTLTRTGTGIDAGVGSDLVIDLVTQEPQVAWRVRRLGRRGSTSSPSPESVPGLQFYRIAHSGPRPTVNGSSILERS